MDKKNVKKVHYVSVQQRIIKTKLPRTTITIQFLKIIILQYVSMNKHFNTHFIKKKNLLFYYFQKPKKHIYKQLITMDKLHLGSVN